MEIMRIANLLEKGNSVNEKLIQLVFKDKRFQKQISENYISYESKKIIIERCSVMYKTISRKYYNRDILFNKKLDYYRLNELSKEDIVETFLELV